MKSLLQKDFQYTPSNRTDLRETFRKERDRIAKEKAAQEHKVQSIFKVKNAK